MTRTGRKNQILLIGITIIFLTLGLTTSAIAASTYNAITSSTLTLTGIVGGDPNALNLWADAYIFDSGTFSDPPPAQSDFLFTSSLPNSFSVGQSLFVEASASGNADIGQEASSFLATQGEWGWINPTANSYTLDFTLDWAMTGQTFSENPSTHLAVAQNYIFADYLDSAGGGSILDVFGRSVNGDGNYTGVGSSVDFTVFIGPGSGGDILISFNDAEGSIMNFGGQGTPPPINPVPIPGSVLLLGSGLLGLVGLSRRKMRV